MRVERVKNGYVLKLSDTGFGGNPKVHIAKTPEELACLVIEWADDIEQGEIEDKRAGELKKAEQKKYKDTCIADRKSHLEKELKGLSS